MRNPTLIKTAQDILKGLLSQCSEEEQMMFKKMYSHQNLELPINDVVNNMDPSKMDWAITQCETTINKRKL